MARIDLKAMRAEILAEIEEFNLLADKRGEAPIIVGTVGASQCEESVPHELFDLSSVSDTWWKYQSNAYATMESLGFTETNEHGIWKRETDTEIAVMRLSTGYETVTGEGKMMDTDSAHFAHHLTLISQSRK